MKRGLNMGSGQRKFHDPTGEIEWANVDKVSRPGHEPDWIADGADLRNLVHDNSVDYYVLHHVLEHFGCGEASGLIKEAHRVLKPGGSLLVFVPDLRALAQRWLAGQLPTQIYMTNVYGAYMGDEADRHKWGFDFPSVFAFIQTTATFLSVRSFDWQPIPGADIARDFWIIGLECTK